MSNQEEKDAMKGIFAAINKAVQEVLPGYHFALIFDEKRQDGKTTMLSSTTDPASLAQAMRFFIKEIDVTVGETIGNA